MAMAPGPAWKNAQIYCQILARLVPILGILLKTLKRYIYGVGQGGISSLKIEKKIKKIASRPLKWTNSWISRSRSLLWPSDQHGEPKTNEELRVKN